MGILSCLLAFSTFTIILSLMILGIGQYYDRHYQMGMLLLAVGGLALLPELVTAMLLATAWGESKKHRIAEKVAK